MLKRAGQNQAWRLSAHWLAILLLFVSLGLLPAAPTPARASWLPAELDDVCPPLDDGALVQGSGPEIYLLRQGALHWIPDLATFIALGYLDASVIHWPDLCLQDVPRAEPIPSVQPVELARDAAAAPEMPIIRIAPVATATPSRATTSVSTPTGGTTTRLGPVARSGAPTDSALILSANADQLPLNATLTLSAQATEPESGSYTLTIQRLRTAGGPAGGLVANCAGVPTCVGQTRGSQASDVSYLATLYRCDGRGACIAERSSNTVTVRWR